MVKIIVISDTHGETSWIHRALERHPDAAALIHCGDFASDLKDLDSASLQLYAVSGNVPDTRQSLLPPELRAVEKILHLEGVKILLTHGHLYEVKFSFNALYYRAQEVGASLVLFGHTHRAMNEAHLGVTLFNPGSPARPRGGKPGYGIIELTSGNFESRLMDF